MRLLVRPIDICSSRSGMHLMFLENLSNSPHLSSRTLDRIFHDGRAAVDFRVW